MRLRARGGGGRFGRGARWAVLFACALLASVHDIAYAVERTPKPSEPPAEIALGERMNANTITVITGTPGGTYFRAGADLAFALDDGDRMRILPILGKGAGENAYDLRFLKGVDLGFVRTDTLEQLRQDKRLKNIEQRIQYIAKLFNDELHILAPLSVEKISDLAGKRVSFDVKGSGTDYSGRVMFKELGISVDPVNVDQPTALEMLRKGEIAAVVSVAAKPVAFLEGFDPKNRFHLVPATYSETMNEAYVPATLNSVDYPRLVGAQPVETVAVGSILGVYNSPKGSPRYEKLVRFIDAFFGQFDKFLSPPRHPKWREVNLAASVSGWTRFRPAQDWLDRHRGPDAAPSPELTRFFQSQAGRSADKDEVYRAYLKWRRSQ